MKKIILFGAFCFCFIACGDGNAKLEAEKWKAVMDNHDVVMPMMATTNKVRKNLKKVLENSQNLVATDSSKISQLINDLNKADEGMMDWMNGFQQLEKLQNEKKHAEILSYLEEQDKVIKKVGGDMTNSIKDGMSFIKKIGEK